MSYAVWFALGDHDTEMVFIPEASDVEDAAFRAAEKMVSEYGLGWCLLDVVPTASAKEDT